MEQSKKSVNRWKMENGRWKIILIVQVPYN
jgi:hypothetical protein